MYPFSSIIAAAVSFLNTHALTQTQTIILSPPHCPDLQNKLLLTRSVARRTDNKQSMWCVCVSCRCHTIVQSARQEEILLLAGRAARGPACSRRAAPPSSPPLPRSCLRYRTISALTPCQCDHLRMCVCVGVGLVFCRALSVCVGLRLLAQTLLSPSAHSVVPLF